MNKRQRPSSRTAANDNAPGSRRVVSDLPADFPVAEAELQLIETYLSAVIDALAREPANDNAPDDQGGER